MQDVAAKPAKGLEAMGLQARAEQAKPDVDAVVQVLGNRIVAIRGELTDLTTRRNELQSQRHLLGNDAGLAHDARIAAIDARAMKLEQELFETTDRLRDAQAGQLPAVVQVRTEPARGLSNDVRAAMQDAVFESFGMATMGLLGFYALWRGFRRFIWRRPPAAELRDHSAQLLQLQQSMDVIALEVERISEAQRYTAKLLSEKSGEKMTSVRA